jgi:hypothetical protein
VSRPGGTKRKVAPLPTRALVIAAPYIDYILSGAKTWEMRTRPTRVRETIGLIRKGSGQIVGVAEIVDSTSDLSHSQSCVAHIDVMEFERRT